MCCKLFLVQRESKIIFNLGGRSELLKSRFDFGLVCSVSVFLCDEISLQFLNNLLALLKLSFYCS
jgi:hypothetical protein